MKDDAMGKTMIGRCCAFRDAWLALIHEVAEELRLYRKLDRLVEIINGRKKEE